LDKTRKLKLLHKASIVDHSNESWARDANVMRKRIMENIAGARDELAVGDDGR